MTYSNYATKLNNDTNLIQQLLTSLENIDLESSWEGNASKKQITNLRTILTDKNTQLHNIDDLTSALLLIDEYDNEKKLVKEYETNINNLNREDPNYQEKNPNTRDNINLYLYLLISSLTGIILLIVSFIKEKKQA